MTMSPRVFAVALLAVAVCSCAVQSRADETHAPLVTPSTQNHVTDGSSHPSIFYGDPMSACLGRGGKYLGGMKCQMPDGSVAAILVGAISDKARESEIPIAPKTPQAWALATSAINSEVNQERHDLLSGVVATPDNEEPGKQQLARWWGINNRADLLKTLSWLQFEGHRSAFEKLGQQVDSMSEHQLMAAQAALQMDASALHTLLIVRQNHLALGQKGILGWDLVRYIALCRYGYLAAYLTKSEAWDRIMPAALRLQQTFNSWQDLESNYLIGREFWSAQQTQVSGERYRAVYERLIRDPSSPWNVNPWSMDLGVATPLPIVADSNLETRN